MGILCPARTCRAVGGLSRVVAAVILACVTLPNLYVFADEPVANGSAGSQPVVAPSSQPTQVSDDTAATWNDGQLAVEELRWAARSEAVRLEVLGLAGEDLGERVARHLAVVRILAREGRRLGLDKAPGFALQAKLTEQRVLAGLLLGSVKAEALAAVSDEEIAAFRASHPQLQPAPEAIDLRRIRVDSARHQDAADRAKSAYRMLAAGRAFAQIAAQYSDIDPADAEVKRYDPHVLPKSLVSAVVEAGEGKLLGPLATDGGFEIVRVEGLHRPSNPEEMRDQVRFLLAEQRIAEKTAELRDLAATFVLQPQQVAGQQEENVIVLRAGAFVVDLRDVRLAAQQMGMNAETPEALATWLLQLSEGNIEMGELARSMGLDRGPGGQLAIGYAIDKCLADATRDAMLPERATDLIGEERLRAFYDNDWTQTVDAKLEYDALIVPVNPPANATPEQREAADKQARNKAAELIRKVQAGGDLDALARAEGGLKVLTGEQRLVQASSPLAGMLTDAKQGQVLGQPHADYGGYCVVRVKAYQPQQKTPYELARRYVIEQVVWKDRANLQRKLDSQLLKENRFVYRRTASERLGG